MHQNQICGTTLLVIIWLVWVRDECQTGMNSWYRNHDWKNGQTVKRRNSQIQNDRADQNGNHLHPMFIEIKWMNWLNHVLEFLLLTLIVWDRLAQRAYITARYWVLPVIMVNKRKFSEEPHRLESEDEEDEEDEQEHVKRRGSIVRSSWYDVFPSIWYN